MSTKKTGPRPAVARELPQSGPERVAAIIDELMFRTRDKDFQITVDGEEILKELKKHGYSVKKLRKPSRPVTDEEQKLKNTAGKTKAEMTKEEERRIAFELSKQLEKRMNRA